MFAFFPSPFFFFYGKMYLTGWRVGALHMSMNKNKDALNVVQHASPELHPKLELLFFSLNSLLFLVTQLE